MSIIGPRPQTKRCFDAFPASSRNRIVKVRPGLSGIGSIVFRDEENLLNKSADPNVFYDSVIMPYKGILEEWYVDNSGLLTYAKCILATIWVVLLPKTKIVWHLFPSLPRPPGSLSAYIVT